MAADKERRHEPREEVEVDVPADVIDFLVRILWEEALSALAPAVRAKLNVGNQFQPKAVILWPKKQMVHYGLGVQIMLDN